MTRTVPLARPVGRRRAIASRRWRRSSPGATRSARSSGEAGWPGSSRARDLRLHRAVAVKLLPLDAAAAADPTARQRFVREARAAASFTHPNAVAVFDAGDADGVLYLVMELVDGPSLAAVLAERGPLGVAEALRIGDQVLQALGAAHRAGIVHRDVKPGNVLLGVGRGRQARRLRHRQAPRRSRRRPHRDRAVRRHADVPRPGAGRRRSRRRRRPTSTRRACCCSRCSPGGRRTMAARRWRRRSPIGTRRYPTCDRAAPTCRRTSPPRCAGRWPRIRPTASARPTTCAPPSPGRDCPRPCPRRSCMAAAPGASSSPSWWWVALGAAALVAVIVFAFGRRGEPSADQRGTTVATVRDDHDDSGDDDHHHDHHDHDDHCPDDHGLHRCPRRRRSRRSSRSSTPTRSGSGRTPTSCAATCSGSSTARAASASATSTGSATGSTEWTADGSLPADAAVLVGAALDDHRRAATRRARTADRAS